MYNNLINLLLAGDNTIIIVAGANNLLCENDIQNASSFLAHTSVVVFQFETPLQTTLKALELIKRINSNCEYIKNIRYILIFICYPIILNEIIWFVLKFLLWKTDGRILLK